MRARACVALAVALCAAAVGCSDPAQRERAEHLVLHPDMPKEIREAIRKKAIVRGMTKADVRVCWGRPRKIETVGERSEAWIYRRRVYVAGGHVQLRTYRIVFIEGRVASFGEIGRTR